ncbi:hypothetical protein OUZ56_020549 [Daphnia magna]|uniref:Uncharacterized protein n=1 Tax=Daphnia magna TaxID=35525 RepID=A0ABQ9ZES6_9CRUS|nr:hypothetical protein OUZ56_020549 [Daphnia magna]
MSKRKQKDVVGPRQRSRRVRTFIEEHMHLLEEEVSNDDFHETMADGVENDDHHSIHSSIHSSSESDVNFLEEVDADSETFSDFDFDFCKAPNFDENLVDDVDDWEVDSDIDNDLNAIDNQNFFKRRLCH